MKHKQLVLKGFEEMQEHFNSATEEKPAKLTPKEAMQLADMVSFFYALEQSRKQMRVPQKKALVLLKKLYSIARR